LLHTLSFFFPLRSEIPTLTNPGLYFAAAANLVAYSTGRTYCKNKTYRHSSTTHAERTHTKIKSRNLTISRSDSIER
jgi:hypothetical protein